jgi:hypothetical protein
MKKSQKWFYITVSFTIALILAYMGLVAFFFRTPKTTLWVDDFMNVKESIAKNIVGNKIVILGGSASHFGIRTKDIQKELKIPVVNMAVCVALDTDYILFRVKQSLKPGDIIILPFEYELYSYNEVPSTIKLEYLFTYDRNYLFHTSPLTVMRYLLSVNRDQIITAMRERKDKNNRKHPVERGGVYTSLGLNENGDATSNDGKEDFVSLPLAMPIGEPKPRPGLTMVKEFSEWCKRNNVTLYVSYPNTVYNAEYEKPYYKYYFETLNNYFVRNNIPVLGNPYMFFYDKDLFYNSFYHLNKQGMTKRTAQLIQLIKGLDPVKKLAREQKIRMHERYGSRKKMKTPQSQLDHATVSERLLL